MRSPFMVFSRERVKNQGSTCHGLTWLKSKGSVTQGLALSEVTISPSPYHLSKFDFRHCLIPPVLVSLLLRDSGFDSPVIVIVKICISLFDKNLQKNTNRPILGHFRKFFVFSGPSRSGRLLLLFFIFFVFLGFRAFWAL